NIGCIYFIPTVPTLFSRSAPAAISALMIGSGSFAVFVGSTISGRLGGLYERLSPARFWLLHAAVVSAGGILILLFARRLRHELTVGKIDALTQLKQSRSFSQ